MRKPPDKEGAAGRDGAAALGLHSSWGTTGSDAGNTAAGCNAQLATKLAAASSAAAIADGIWHVKRARNALMAAMFRFDDAGVECFDLNENYGKLADLAAQLEGRARPYNAWPRSFPDWAVVRAQEWRAERARRERR